jgi:hypothetical protein
LSFKFKKIGTEHFSEGVETKLKTGENGVQLFLNFILKWEKKKYIFNVAQEKLKKLNTKKRVSHTRTHTTSKNQNNFFFTRLHGPQRIFTGGHASLLCVTQLAQKPLIIFFFDFVCVCVRNNGNAAGASVCVCCEVGRWIR